MTDSARALSAVAPATLTDRAIVETFLYREARLADESRYDEWLALWRDPAVYWVPANEDDYDPEQHLSIIYDDYQRLCDRVDRLKTGAAWAQDPPSRLRRLISNVEIGAVAGNVLTVSSNFVLGESRRGRQRSYYARQIHTLHAGPDGFRMSGKKVLLIDNDAPIHNLTFLI